MHRASGKQILNFFASLPNTDLETLSLTHFSCQSFDISRFPQGYTTSNTRGFQYILLFFTTDKSKFDRVMLNII